MQSEEKCLRHNSLLSLEERHSASLIIYVYKLFIYLYELYEYYMCRNDDRHKPLRQHVYTKDVLISEKKKEQHRNDFLSWLVCRETRIAIYIY